MPYQTWPELREMLINQGATHILPADTHTPSRVTARVYRMAGSAVQMRELGESVKGGAWKALYYWAGIYGSIPDEAVSITNADVPVGSEELLARRQAQCRGAGVCGAARKDRPDD